MNINEENKAKEFYIKSDINGIHTPRTNMVEINYLDMLKLMHSYSQEVVKNLSISGVSVSLCFQEDLASGIRCKKQCDSCKKHEDKANDR